MTALWLELVAGWWLIGVAGYGLTYIERRYWKYDPRPWCPAPIEIFAAVFCGFLGPVLLLIGIIIILTSREMMGKTWWYRPLCDSKDKAK